MTTKKSTKKKKAAALTATPSKKPARAKAPKAKSVGEAVAKKFADDLGIQVAEAAPAKAESASDIIRRIHAANRDARFADVVRLCEAEGVKANTARGVIVRLKKAERAGSEGASA
jgi:hypothetical protein